MGFGSWLAFNIQVRIGFTNTMRKAGVEQGESRANYWSGMKPKPSWGMGEAVRMPCSVSIRQGDWNLCQKNALQGRLGRLGKRFVSFRYIHSER
jgi:hypothetical protein